MPTLAKGRLLLALIVAVYVLRLAAQLAVTPLGEGLDFFSHLAYIVFMVEQGRPPVPDEQAVPDWVARLAAEVPGPDDASKPVTYRSWAALDEAERAQRRAALNGDTTTAAYITRNYQSQHPPLYYWLLGGVYRLFPAGLTLDARVYWLGLVSVALSALALPGIYQTLRLHLDETPALLAVLALAWYPNLLPFLARISNDTLAIPLLVWGLYFCLRARVSQQRRHWVVAGGLLALACFTKTYALTLLPVYLLCAAVGEKRLTWRNLGVAVPVTVAALGSFAAFNLATTGHLVPLTEMQQTDTLPLLTRLAALFQVDPVWFVGGLAKGFWWLGFWSFVSPGLFYYLPPLALAYVLAVPPRTGGAAGDRFSVRTLWPHYAALALFTAGLLWHAAMFTLAARLDGLSVHSGNEGWYLNVLLGSVFVIAGVLLERRLSAGAFRRVLAGLVVFFMVWSAVGQAALIAFWGGAVPVQSRLRAVAWGEALPALLRPETWADWFALPGILQPVAFTGLLPLLLALAGTGLVLHLLGARRLAALPVLADE